jgi:hypothetical protein
MQQNFKSTQSLENVASSRTTVPPVRTAPIELDMSLLRHVAGGVSPKGTWASAVIAVQSPKGTW